MQDIILLSLLALIVACGGFWFGVVGTRLLNRRKERLIKSGKWVETKAEIVKSPSPRDVTDNVASFFYLAVTLGVIFIVGVVIFAIIKWAFQTVF